MNQYGFSGLEIAPTRVFQTAPYQHLKEATKWSHQLKAQYGIKTVSLQSIWYGKSESLFSSERDYTILLNYTKDAIKFANAVGAHNLVFGCPKNRNDGYTHYNKALEFFTILAKYAESHNTVLSIEANPVIYNTNFINNTSEALKLVKDINQPGFKINLDVGTMIYNNEQLSILEKNINLINHVHISEPGLVKIIERAFHKDLFKLLKANGYNHFISIEMNNKHTLDDIIEVMAYVSKCCT